MHPFSYTRGDGSVKGKGRDSGLGTWEPKNLNGRDSGLGIWGLGKFLNPGLGTWDW